MASLSKDKFQELYGKESYNQFYVEPVQGRFSDVGEDIVSGVKGIGQDFSTRLGNVGESIGATVQGEQRPEELAFQYAGQSAGFVGDVIGRGITTLGKFFTKESEEEAISQKVGELVESTGIPEYVASLSPRAQRNVEAVMGVGEFATLKGLSSIVNRTAQTALKQSDDVLTSSKARIGSIKPITPKGISQIIKDARFSLSDVDPQVETALKRSSFEDVNRHFNQARNAAKDTRAITPLELAGEKAEQAYNVIDQARLKAVKGKNNILNEVAETNVPGNIINDVMSEGIQNAKSRFGISISANGQIDQTAGRFSKLDNADQKLLTEYYSRLNSLGVSPTVRQVDDFVDWAQSQLYKQSKTLSTLEAADKAVVGHLKAVTGDLNGQLKETVGGGYGEVNARISKLIELQDELSRSLGADARKGGGLMKRLFSPTGGNTRRIFKEIRKETGIDLDKEANLARFSMENVGDVRQRSLLQSLDVGLGEASQIDLTKPVTIVNFIRERADMDAQELANEIIRRASETSQQ